MQLEHDLQLSRDLAQRDEQVVLSLRAFELGLGADAELHDRRFQQIELLGVDTYPKGA